MAKTADSRKCEIALLSIWTVGVLSIGILVAAQSIRASASGTSSDYIGTRISVVSILVLPVLGIVFGIAPIKKAHRGLRSFSSINAVVFSAGFLLSVFLLAFFEDDYYPGELMNMLGFWGILLGLAQTYLAWSITRLASR